MQSLAFYLRDFVAACRRSWTMISIAFFAVLGVAEAQFMLLKPYLGEKAYGVAYFVVLAIIAIARARTLRP